MKNFLMNWKQKLNKYSFLIYIAIVLGLLGLFFTNDFGLIDIHKASLITAVGVDVSEEGEMQITAQLAVPKPSENGENVQFVEVQGSGLTVADALNEINAKTGFYPKLQFCKIILLGESCQKKELFRCLGCFYRKNYSELTALVAMCKGKASEMLAMPTPATDTSSLSVQRVLTDELKKSANVSSVNLKDIAIAEYSESAACFMPYIEANKPGTSEPGGGGDNVGGEPAEGGQSGGGQGGGQEGGSSGGSGGGGSGGAEEGEVEFTARKTAIFTHGKFAGILDEQQSFALDILKNYLRLVVVPCPVGEKSYTLGMKNASGGVSLEVNNGVPTLTLAFKAKAQIQGVMENVNPQKTGNDDVVPKDVLKGAEEEVTRRLEELVAVCVEQDCDILGVKTLLFKHYNKYYDAFKEDLLQRMKVEYKIDIKSLN